MDFQDVLNHRRSIRRFSADKVPEEVMQNAFLSASLAPNSSNTQTWDFYWIQSLEKKKQMMSYCLNQSAARTAGELVVVVASPTNWKRSQSRLIEWARKSGAPEQVINYYQKLVPVMYSWGFLNIIGIIKTIMFFLIGIFRPIMRRPAGRRDIQEVAIKSAALAAENFVLSISNSGYSSCMMEGFDEYRIKKLLKLKYSDRIVMVIAVGKETENGTWGPRYRIPLNEIIHKV